MLKAFFLALDAYPFPTPVKFRFGYISGKYILFSCGHPFSREFTKGYFTGMVNPPSTSIPLYEEKDLVPELKTLK